MPLCTAQTDPWRFESIGADTLRTFFNAWSFDGVRIDADLVENLPGVLMDSNQIKQC